MLSESKQPASDQKPSDYLQRSGDCPQVSVKDENLARFVETRCPRSWSVVMFLTLRPPKLADYLGHPPCSVFDQYRRAIVP